MKTKKTSPYQEVLENVGLNTNEALIYEKLIEGPQKAHILCRKTGVKRTLVYKALNDLIEKGLCHKNTEDKVTTYIASSPEKIIDLQNERRKIEEEKYKELNKVLGSLLSTYNLNNHKPNTRFYVGVEGLQAVYDDIIKTGDNYFLIRSPEDDKIDLTRSMIYRQIKKQVKKGIKVRAFTPRKLPLEKEIREKDLAWNLDRVVVDVDKFKIPAQISIYGKKVAITSYRDDGITTIIESEAINETFRIIFEYIWNVTKPESDKIISKFKQPDIKYPPEKFFWGNK